LKEEFVLITLALDIMHHMFILATTSNTFRFNPITTLLGK